MAMARGYKSTIGLDYETTFGSDPASPNQVLMPVNSADVKANRNLITPETITGTRNPVEPAQGNETVSGTIVVPMDALSMGYWLKGFFGPPTTTGTGPYTHVYKLSDSQPSMVLEKRFATSTPLYAKMNGCKISSLASQFGGDGELVVNIGIEGATETVGTTAYDASPTQASLLRLHNFGATVKIGGSSVAYITDISFDLNSGLDTGVYTIGGGGTRGDIPEGLASVSGSLTALFEDSTLIDLAQAGSESSIEISTASGSSSLTWLFPEIVMERTSPGITGPQGIRVSMNWRGYYANNSDNTAVKVTLITSKSSY